MVVFPSKPASTAMLLGLHGKDCLQQCFCTLDRRDLPSEWSSASGTKRLFIFAGKLQPCSCNTDTGVCQLPCHLVMISEQVPGIFSTASVPPHGNSTSEPAQGLHSPFDAQPLLACPHHVWWRTRFAPTLSFRLQPVPGGRSVGRPLDPDITLWHRQRSGNPRPSLHSKQVRSHKTLLC